MVYAGIAPPQADFYLKVGNLAPPLQVALADETGKRLPPLPLGSIATCTMTRRGTQTTVVNNQLMGFTAVLIGGVLYRDPTYFWKTGDTAMVGMYQVEVTIYFPSGNSQTFPDPVPFLVYIGPVLPNGL